MTKECAKNAGGDRQIFLGDYTICSNHKSGSSTFVAVNKDGLMLTWSLPGGELTAGNFAKSLGNLIWIGKGVDKAFCSHASYAALGTDTSVGSWGGYGGDSSSVASKLVSGIVDIFMTDYAFAALTDQGGLVTWEGMAGSGGDSSSVFLRPNGYKRSQIDPRLVL